MCEFISWKEYNGKIWFLTDKVVKPRLAEFKKYNPGWRDDLSGHGAIEWFFNLPSQCEANKECTDFSSPKNFPPEIVEAIKAGALSTIGYGVHILTEPARAEYEKIRGLALAEYEKIERQALVEYEKIRGQAWAEYEKIRGQAWVEYEKIERQALAEYEKIRGPALVEYEKIRGQAWVEHEKIRGQSFWEIARVVQNRTRAWH